MLFYMLLCLRCQINVLEPELKVGSSVGNRVGAQVNFGEHATNEVKLGLYTLLAMHVGSATMHVLPCAISEDPSID